MGLGPPQREGLPSELVMLFLHAQRCLVPRVNSIIGIRSSLGNLFHGGFLFFLPLLRIPISSFPAVVSFSLGQGTRTKWRWSWLNNRDELLELLLSFSFPPLSCSFFLSKDLGYQFWSWHVGQLQGRGSDSIQTSLLLSPSGAPAVGWKEWTSCYKHCWAPGSQQKHLNDWYRRLQSTYSSCALLLCLTNILFAFEPLNTKLSFMDPWFH